MNQLMAKIREKSRTENKYRKIIADQTIYSLPDNLEQSVEYSPSTLLEDEQWYYIAHFTQEEYCIDLLNNGEFDSVDFELLKKDDSEKIDYIFSVQNEIYYFQNVSRKQLYPKKLISFGDNFSFDPNNVSIAIKDFPDAIFMKNKDILYFKKLETIKSIFTGIEVLYREATNEEVKAFLESEFITLTNDYNVEDVKISNRKRIALVMDTLKKYKDDEKKQIFDYIKGYCPSFSTENEIFSIGNESDLKQFLYGLEQRFYTTPVGSEKRIANSIIKLN